MRKNPVRYSYILGDFHPDILIEAILIKKNVYAFGDNSGRLKICLSYAYINIENFRWKIFKTNFSISVKKFFFLKTLGRVFIYNLRNFGYRLKENLSI